TAPAPTGAAGVAYKISGAAAAAGKKLEKLSGLKSMGKGAWGMMKGFTVIRATRMAAMANIHFTKEELLSLNKTLNRLKKKS
ncbi:MAG TPA: hypothetical protein PLS28_06130, partial [Clostridiales bacterium]|nr:hypothetical protein [Clostridiales bacterium]